MADLVIPALAYGSAFRSLGTVVHDAETPLRAGYASSLAINWFAQTRTASAHTMHDPRDTVRMVPDAYRAYHAGPYANPVFHGDEQAGYARFTREQWLTPAGIAQMTRLARTIRERHQRLDLPLRVIADPGEVRSLVRAGRPVGVIYHVTVRDALGGTSHWDPGLGYPTDQLQEALTGASDPTPTDQEDDMAFPVYTIFAHGGRTGAANSVTGTYRFFRNDYEYSAFLARLNRSGIPADNWGDVGGLDLAAHFGTEVTS